MSKSCPEPNRGWETNLLALLFNSAPVNSARKAKQKWHPAVSLRAHHLLWNPASLGSKRFSFTVGFTQWLSVPRKADLSSDSWIVGETTNLVKILFVHLLYPEFLGFFVPAAQVLCHYFQCSVWMEKSLVEIKILSLWIPFLFWSFSFMHLKVWYWNLKTLMMFMCTLFSCPEFCPQTCFQPRPRQSR